MRERYMRDVPCTMRRVVGEEREDDDIGDGQLDAVSSAKTQEGRWCELSCKEARPAYLLV